MSDALRFFIGLHIPAHAAHFDMACISINRLRGRRKPIDCPSVLVDSGAFTEVSTYGRYRHGVAEYAAELRRLHEAGVVRIAAAVAQDFMCEPFIVRRTGLSVEEHQRLTIERYDALVAECLPFPIMPVLQGYQPEDYARHVRDYGSRLTPGMWVGVGSVCKRNGNPAAVVAVLEAIHRVRPDLRLHGFGLKLTALRDPAVRELLATADSMAWSFAARRNGGNANDWREAARYCAEVNQVTARPVRARQLSLLLEAA